MSTNPNILSIIDASELIVEVSPESYSASLVARAVEDADAHLMGLSINTDSLSSPRWRLSLIINRRDPSAAVRSLERYGFEVVGVRSDSSVDDQTARRRALELLHLLEI